MKKILGIVGVALVAGAVAYTVIDRNRRKNEIVRKDKGSLIENQNDEYSFIENDEELKNSKIDTLNTISLRHDEAATIMRESIENIEKMNNDIENNSDLIQISRELDEMLGEKENG